ncbi:TPA: hypothetical protein ACRUL4_001305 [Legionella pneumophila]|nr:hypothetical protein [Legionella pneumophila]HAT1882796.1 hypothetical protein [Legionella pneumophila]HAT2114167.1 hypothetical protein [Legionella pneumophila]HAT8720958.1 hypothetical protein [Legionella pneumophila]
MDISFSFLKDAFLRLHAFILKTLGKKIVALDEFNDEEVEVDFNFPKNSPQCIKEENDGSKFRWAKVMHSGYVRYFEIDGNTRRYFTWKDNQLWIKRN